MPSPSNPPVDRSHLLPLDGIRGLAILMVIALHAFSANSVAGGAVTVWLGNLLYYGMFGVDLFFVLSGFLITGILVDTIAKPGYFSKFYARRALRIFPLYYGVLLVLFLLTPLLHLHWGAMGWLMPAYLQNLRPIAFNHFTPGMDINLNHFWSLAVEEQFYLVWPSIVFFVQDWRRLLWVTLAGSVGALVLRLALIGLGVSHEVVHVTTLARADSLLLGGTLALLFRSAYWPRVVRLAPYGFLAAVSAVLLSIALLGTDASQHPRHPVAMLFWINGPRYTVLALGSACLIAWSLRPMSRCGRFFEGKALSFFGRYSYGIYVLHLIALSYLIRAQRAAILGVTHSKLLAVVGAGVSTLVLSVLAAYLSFHLYERPFLQLKRHFAYGARPVKSREVETV